MSRHAFLILTHGPAQQVAELIEALSHPDHSFFVHVDRKADLESYQAVLPADAVVIPERFDVWRKCWSMIDATQAVLRAAIDDPRDFQWFTLLSGADYPILSAGEIARRFEGLDRDLVHFFRIGDRPEWLPRVTRRHYRDGAYLLQRASGAVARSVVRLRLAVLRRVHVVVDKRRGGFVPPAGTELCGGSQWWSLRRGTAEFLLSRLSDRRVRKFFRYVDGPDEIVVQTLLWNSPARARLAAIESYENWRLSERSQFLPEPVFNWRYVDWDQSRCEVPPEGGAPRGPTTLDERDLEALLQSGAVLARKFDPRRSESLRRLINETHRPSEP